MTRSSESLWLGAVCMLLSMGCNEQASVGTDPGKCYAGVRCEELFFDIRLEETLSISSREGVEVLTPTWTLEKLGDTSLVPVVEVPTQPEDSPPLWFPEPPGVTLALGAEQGLWAFARGQEHLQAWELSASGAVVRETAIARPEGVEPAPGEDAVYSFCTVQSHEAGPVLTLTWSKACQGTGQTLCEVSETLVFQESLEREPVRLRGASTPGLASCTQVAFRNSTGDALIVEDYNAARVRKVNLSGDTLWEQTPPWQVVKDFGYVIERNITASDGWIAGLSLTRDYQPDWYPPDMVFLRVSERGASLQFAWIAAGIPFTRTSNLARRTLFDPQGRLLVLTTGGYLNGSEDLWIIRSSGDGSPGKAVAITREDYLPLLPGPSSVDPEGNLYVALRIGGRQPDRQDAILCQVRESFDEARCFYIDAVPSALEASAEGVVYTASPAGIQRYDLP